MIAERFERPPQNRPPADQLILLWNGAAGPQAGPAGDHHGCNCHVSRLPAWQMTGKNSSLDRFAAVAKLHKKCPSLVGA
jgi:hypothetical protein